MHRMLIVDDEPIIVEGLIELFQDSKQLDLELLQANDGVEALEMAKELRIDILLTDYQMPEMNGLELQKEIMRRWPRCKVIFLTGFNDFDYIQSTLRQGAIDFVLKTEGDEPIQASVEKAIKYIEEEVSYDRLIRNARSQMSMALPSLRKAYLRSLLHNDSTTTVARKEKFDELQIPLDAQAPLYVVLGRIDHWREEMVDGDQALFMYAVQNIVEEFFQDHFVTSYVDGEHGRMIWLLQPDHTIADINTTIMGTLESVQTSTRQYLKLVTSFVVSSESFNWEDLSPKFDRLTVMFERGLGLGEETLLSGDRIFADVKQQQLDSRIRKIRVLDQYLTQKDKEKFFNQFEDIFRAVEEEQALQTGISLEVFYELTAIFIKHINRLEVFSELSNHINISKLLSIREHTTWQEVTSFFRELAERLFEYMLEERDQATYDVVQKIHDYIEKNLHGDLTLNRLSDHVYLTPFYVSRLYKQRTGLSITDYIAQRRIDKAKQLLEETQNKVNEIGMKIGYDSAAYFTRFFKKMTGITPQEFRESIRET